jgi:hypothetical protein
LPQWVAAIGDRLLPHQQCRSNGLSPDDAEELAVLAATPSLLFSTIRPVFSNASASAASR